MANSTMQNQPAKDSLSMPRAFTQRSVLAEDSNILLHAIYHSVPMPAGCTLGDTKSALTTPRSATEILRWSRSISAFVFTFLNGLRTITRTRGIERVSLCLSKKKQSE